MGLSTCSGSLSRVWRLCSSHKPISDPPFATILLCPDPPCQCSPADQAGAANWIGQVSPLGMSVYNHGSWQISSFVNVTERSTGDYHDHDWALGRIEEFTECQDGIKVLQLCGTVVQQRKKNYVNSKARITTASILINLWVSPSTYMLFRG